MIIANPIYDVVFKRLMENEQEFWRTYNEHFGKALGAKDKELEAKDKALEEKEKAIKEKDKALDDLREEIERLRLNELRIKN
jgi:dephospho-CoA kinase